MIASATADQYRQAMEIIGSDPSIDAVVVIFIPPLMTKPEDVAPPSSMARAPSRKAKPVVTVFMQSRGVPDELRSADVRVPSYSFPENAARALARVASYGEWLTRPSTLPVFDDIQKDECSAIIDKAAASGGGWLEPHDVWSVLSRRAACAGAACGLVS